MQNRKGIRSYKAIALTKVFPKWYASCIILRLEQELEGTARGRLEGNKLTTPAGDGKQTWYKNTGNGRRTELPC